MRRQQAMAAAEENRRLAENKRRNEMAARVRVDLKEETDITRNKYKIQSGIIRWDRCFLVAKECNVMEWNVCLKLV